MNETLKTHFKEDFLCEAKLFRSLAMLSFPGSSEMFFFLSLSRMIPENITTNENAVHQTLSRTGINFSNSLRSFRFYSDQRETFLTAEHTQIY